MNSIYSLRRRICALGVVAALGLSVAACGSGSGSSDDATYKIGQLASLSGSQSSLASTSATVRKAR